MEKRTIPLIDDTWEVGIDAGKFWNTLWDSLFELGDFKVGSFLKKLTGTVKKDETLQDLAFDLVFRSLHEACTILVKENCPEALERVSNMGSVKEGFKFDSKKQLEELKAGIDESFFEHPDKWPFLRVFIPGFSHWLQDALNVDPLDAQLISRSLPLQFWKELIAEWDRHPLKYQPLKGYFSNNPFSKNINLFELRQDYYRKIFGFYLDKVMNDERITLADMYIPPNFKIYQRNLPKSNAYADDRDGFVSLSKDGEHIHDYLCDHFFRKNPAFGLKAETSRLLLLLGQPGQGKTSFTYRTMHDIKGAKGLEQELMFVRLNKLGDPRQFVKTPIDELQAYFSREKFTVDKGILILDGLDELYMSEGLTKAEINDFFLKMRKILDERQELFVIITSRFHYVNLSMIGKDDALILSLAPLTLAQQQDWLSRYRHFHPKGKLDAATLNRIHEEREGKLKALWELVNQPILLHLVAKADFEIGETVNRGKIYEELFDTLIQRSWSDKQLTKFEDLDPNDFRAYLRALAHRIYQSDREFITVKELEEWQEQTHPFIKDNLKSEYEDLGDAMKDVLITFYFRSVEDAAERAEAGIDRKSSTIEFYHKSLQEYLAMEHVWHSVKEQVLDKNQKGRFILQDWKDALELFWRLSTPKGLTSETSTYLREVIENDQDEKAKIEMHARLLPWMDDFFQQQFILRYEADSKTASPIDQGLHCFYVFWTVHSILKVGEVHLPEHLKGGFTRLLTFHQRFRGDFFYIEGANLADADLEGANLVWADLASANLEEANLKRANLYGANLKNANLKNADLENADLGNAGLENADLENAGLENAYLHSAYLEGANLENAYLGSANLGSANFGGANMENADLVGADLVGADLVGANLENADLGGANLKDAKNLTVEQLQKVETLYEVKNLDPELSKGLEDSGYGHLFDKPDWLD
jgi:hypothetical protein